MRKLHRRSLNPSAEGTPISRGYHSLGNTVWNSREAQKLRTVRRRLNNFARKQALAYDTTPRLRANQPRVISMAEFLASQEA